MPVVRATDRLITPTGVNLGDMTGGGGINAAFDVNTLQAIAACATKAAATFGFAGRTLTTPRTIRRALLYGSTDQGYVSGSNPNVTLQLYAKLGAAPANSTDGTLQGTNGPTADTANESLSPRIITAASPLVLPAHVWVRLSHSGGAATIGISEAFLFEEWSPEDDYPNEYTDDNPLFGWHSVVSSDVISVTSAEAANPVENLANPSTSLKWRATSAAEQVITLAVSGLGPFDYVGIARHNFASAGIAVSVETAIGISLVPPFVPADDGPLLIQFPSTETNQVQVRLAAGSDPAQAAVLYLGRLMVAQRRFYVDHVPLTMGREVNAVSPLSESGEFLGRIVLGEHSSTEVSLSNLTPAWVRSDFKPFLDATVESPFFFAWRPGTYPLEAGYCWVPQGEVPRPVNQLPNGMMQVSFPLRGITT